MIRRPHVLLFTAHPELHTGLLNSLEARGIPAMAACSPRDAERLIEDRPMTLLIDMVHGSGLDRAGVRKINGRDTGLVLVLHDGTIHETEGPHMDLSVNGFCFIGDWGAIASTTPSDGRPLALH